MVSRARRESVLIEPRDVFRHQTIEALIASSRGVDLDNTPASERGSFAGLSVEQLERLSTGTASRTSIRCRRCSRACCFAACAMPAAASMSSQGQRRDRGLDPERLGRAWRRSAHVTRCFGPDSCGGSSPALLASRLSRCHRSVRARTTGAGRRSVMNGLRLPLPMSVPRVRSPDAAAPAGAAAAAPGRPVPADLDLPSHLMDGWSSARFVGDVRKVLLRRDLRRECDALPRPTSTGCWRRIQRQPKASGASSSRASTSRRSSPTPSARAAMRHRATNAVTPV